MYRTCSVLQKGGHEVLLVGRVRKDSQPVMPQCFQQHRLNCYFQKGKLFYLEYNLRLFFYLLFKDSDVLCSIDLDTALPGLFLKGLKKWRWIIDAHEWFPYVPEVARRPLIQKFWLWVEAKIIPSADSVYTVGKAISEQLERTYGRSVEVVRNAPFLDNSKFENALPDHIQLPQEDFILYQGAVNEGRGLERLLEIIAQTKFHLVIAGDGDMLLQIKERVKLNNLESQVHFLGFIKPQYLPMVTSRARVGYNVSEAVSKSYELSLNNKFFDYTHALLPSVINDFVEYRKLCSDFPVGILVNHDNIEILNALQLLMTDDDVYLKYKNTCKSAREAWNWEIESKTLHKIFQHV